MSALSFPVQLCSCSLRRVAFVKKLQRFHWDETRADWMTYSVCSQQNKVWKFNLSVTRGCSSVVFLWSDEWGYHSGCLFCSVFCKKKVAMSWESCEGGGLWFIGLGILTCFAVKRTFEALVIVVEMQRNAPEVLSVWEYIMFNSSHSLCN